MFLASDDRLPSAAVHRTTADLFHTQALHDPHALKAAPGTRTKDMNNTHCKRNLPARALAIMAALLLTSAVSAAPPLPYAKGPLLDAIDAMPEGSWARLNANSYSNAWTPAELRPLYGNSSNPTPEKIIGAWSSFAWDSTRGDLILYGGGHANYGGNDVYRWRARSLAWERAALPSETQFLGSGTYLSIDGANAAPSSAHTYDNAVYLPHVDRYLNFGGALYNTGGNYVIPSESDPTILRQTGPYLFDPSRADPDKVGGTTGSHVQRVAPFADVVGGEMWENRDIHKHLAGTPLPRSHVNGCTAYSQTPGTHDVIYVGARSGGTALALYRYEITDLDNPWSDSFTQVGRYWTGTSGQTTCAHDPVANIVLRTGNNTSPFLYWDLATAGPSNNDRKVSVTGSVADFVTWLNYIGRLVHHCAMDYDPNRAHFLLWCGAGEVWSVVPPNPLSTEGWTVTAISAPAGEVPPNNVGVGILGKWKYIPGFDVFMGLENSTNGNIWVYKPLGWVRPTASGDGEDSGGGGDGSGEEPPPPANVAPVVAITSPQGNLAVTTGDVLTFGATATDSDGTVTMVTFRINGSAIAITNGAPYAASWTALAAGSYNLTVDAVDDDGASASATPITITVTDPAPPPGEGPQTTRLRQGENGYSGVRDTYLSNYGKTTNYGSSVKLDLDRSNYAPLIRFAVFASEGGPVPDGAVIESAKLRLYKGSYDSAIALHRMLKPWSESEATWNRASASASWSSPGANAAGSDYRATPEAQVSAPWSAGWIEFDIGAAIAAPDFASANYGWKLIAGAGNSNRKEFRSSNHAVDPATRPTLEIVWRAAGDDDDGGGDDGGGEEPPAENQSPTVSLMSPAQGTTAVVGEALTLTASAADSDGSVTSVEFRVNGTAVGTTSASPYSTTWTPTVDGTYLITAIATDDDGARSESQALTVLASTPTPPPDPGTGGTVILQRALDGYAGVRDTYLSNYHKTSNFGATARIDLDKSNYVPLIRFAIFQSEGGPVPDGATIESATLHLYKGNYDSVIAAHAMLTPWVESEATWNRPSIGATWQAAGAGGAGLDYVSTADAQVSAPWSAGGIVLDVTERVRTFATGQANRGWRLVAVSGNSNRKQFASSESTSTTEFRPRLEIRWSMPN